MRSVLAAMAASLLVGCSPEYNWREIRADKDGWSAMLPDRPASMTRRIHLESVEVPMTMQGANVRETTFTVATAELPSDADGARAQALAAMRAGMLRNIAGAQTAERAVVVPVIDAAGRSAGTHPAVRVEATGTIRGRAVSMSAGFAAEGRRAWQWVVMGPDVEAEQASTFLDSFRLIRPAR